MNTHANDHFSDLEDDLDSAPVKENTGQHAKTEQFPCEHCNGTGLYRGVRIHESREHCFACKGKGYFKTSQFDRQRARRTAKQRRLNKEAARLEEFSKKHPGILEFLKEASSWSGFAGGILRGLEKYGSLTDKQIAPVYAMREKAEARNAEYEKRKADRNKANKLDLDLSKLFDLFHTATGSGLKRPKLVVKPLAISLATARSVNAGCLYLKWDGEYAGKVTPEYELWVNSAFSEERPDILAILGKLVDDPLGFAKLYGQETGVCCCCNRELTDPKSIEAGIGPVCQEKWGL